MIFAIDYFLALSFEIKQENVNGVYNYHPNLQ